MTPPYKKKEFIQQPYRPGETIAAIATPPGEGGVAIIRISGNEALAVGEKIFSKKIQLMKSHTARFGSIVNALGERVDDVLVLWMKGPHSYTGEDTIEIHCHGGSLITRRVLEVVLLAGARAAMPGEFTFKAYINGKMDLAQAEAVQALICAKNEKALDAAELQLSGSLSSKINRFQHKLTEIAAILEAWVDFPEEGLEFASMDDVCEGLDSALQEMLRLLKTFQDGKILHDGISLCLIGSPNVGKSSLMNALLDKNRAIVSAVPGTTRDTLEDHMRINGLNFKVIDTAGIRYTTEAIEEEGIRRTKEAMQASDLILWVLDASKQLNHQEQELLSSLPRNKTIAVWNKMDLPEANLRTLDLPYAVAISAHEKTGLPQLLTKIDEVIWKDGAPSREEVVITNIRHKEALYQAIEAGNRVLAGLRTGVSPEFITLDMRACLKELGKIIGSDITEEILSAIFSRFCIGK